MQAGELRVFGLDPARDARRIKRRVGLVPQESALDEELTVLVQISPFFHGVRLLQMAVWNEFSPGKIFYHVSVLIAFAVVLGLWALVQIRNKLIV